jgi:hypothetical protein
MSNGSDTAKGRRGDAAETLTTDAPLRLWLCYPEVRPIDHFDDLGNYFVTNVVRLFESLTVDVFVSEGNLEMHLGFGRFCFCIV